MYHIPHVLEAFSELMVLELKIIYNTMDAANGWKFPIVFS